MPQEFELVIALTVYSMMIVYLVVYLLSRRNNPFIELNLLHG
jgi:hypothetical protein